MRRCEALALLGAAVVGAVVLPDAARAQQAARTRVGVPRASVPASPGPLWQQGHRGQLRLLRSPSTPSDSVGGRALARRAPSGLDGAELRRWAPVASLLLPGSGQAILHQDRFVAFIAAEAWAVLEFATQRTEARRQQNRYRDSARDVARSLYGKNPPVGNWAYYESLEHYLESGVFDRVPGDEVDPEVDVSTYNGAAWLLARQTYWTDPGTAPPISSAAYRNALNFYLVRAVRAEYRWSWRNAQLEQDVYVRTIRRSNTAFREARQALGFVIANHLLSGVDAFMTLRLEGLEGASGRGMALRGRLPFP